MAISLLTRIEVPDNDFQLGQGVDALTGRPLAVALASFQDPTPGEGPTCKIHTRAIKELHELNNDVRIALDATINLGTPDISLTQTAEFLRSHSSSEQQFIIECMVSGEYKGDVLNLVGIQITTEAENAFKDSPEKFRETYGDYFVAGFRRRFRAYTTIFCQGKKNANVHDLETKAEVHFGSILNAGSNLEHSTKDSNEYEGVNAYIYQYGCHASGSNASSQQSGLISAPSKADPESALTTLRNIAAHANQCPETRKEAILMHYSLLPQLPLARTISVSPTLFETLHRTEKQCMKLDIDCFHPALAEDIYRGTMEDTQDAIRTFRSGRPRFAREERDNAILKVKEAVERVDDLIQRYKFLSRLLKTKRGLNTEEIKWGGERHSRRSHGMVDTKVIVAGKKEVAKGEKEIAGGKKEIMEDEGGGEIAENQFAVAQKKEKGLKKLLAKRDSHFRIEKRSRKRTDVDEERLQDFIFRELYHERRDFYIIGWAIINEMTTEAYFCLKSGGLMADNLTLALKGQKPFTLTYRIVYVLKKDYNFPTLIDRYLTVSLSRQSGGGNLPEDLRVNSGLLSPMLTSPPPSNPSSYVRCLSRPTSFSLHPSEESPNAPCST
ncbi:hypothetical protein GYMLUDRAFT_241867 [Collybiopsis luxurians FD-317 M1]|uniref:Uncharacterized protein n=1 Tax=Collybiopsis luxurians FD-317 M1 TaxID=944289 RepID=A0A0D0CKE7_9AGAR|nr:hypothetical protein GYMLUDRAFT_241867 [Collybiopsis luxurians FD-317 M1]